MKHSVCSKRCLSGLSLITAVKTNYRVVARRPFSRGSADFHQRRYGDGGGDSGGYVAIIVIV